MSTEKRERIVEDIEEYAADVLVLASDFNAHLTPENSWPQDQHAALLRKVERFYWELQRMGPPTDEQVREIAADDAVTEMRECRR